MSNSKKYTIKQRKILKKKAWSVFSLWIRKRDGRCVTCGEDKKQLFGGHFCHKREDFNERNINAQCYACNWCRKGNMRVYTMYLIDKYGIDYVRELMKCEKEKPKLETGEFYLDIIKKYSND